MADTAKNRRKKTAAGKKKTAARQKKAATPKLGPVIGPPVKGRLVNRSELAAIFGVAMTTVDAWTNRGMPIVERTMGRGTNWSFDTAAVAAWRTEQAVTQTGDEEKLNFEEARRRKMAADAMLAEIELIERRGEILEIDTVVKEWESLVLSMRARMMAIPPRLAPAVLVENDVATVQAILEDSIYECLRELAWRTVRTDEFTGGGGEIEEIA